MRKLLTLALTALLGVTAHAQQRINSATQVYWPAVTGTVAPTGACNLLNYGQPYTNVTTGLTYVCTSLGWTPPATGTVGSGTTGQFAYYSAAGTTVAGHTLNVTDVAGAGTLSNSTTGNAATATNSAAIGGVTITGNPVAGYVPVATGTTTATWQPNAANNPPFSALANGTNTTANNMLCGTGCSLSYSASGVINASAVGGISAASLAQLNGSNAWGGSNVVGTGGSWTYGSGGTINASSLAGVAATGYCQTSGAGCPASSGGGITAITPTNGITYGLTGSTATLGLGAITPASVNVYTVASGPFFSGTQAGASYGSTPNTAMFYGNTQGAGANYLWSGNSNGTLTSYIQANGNASFVNLGVGGAFDIYGGNPIAVGTPSLRSITANGNVVLNGYNAGSVYLNWDTGTGGVQFGNGASVTVATVSSTGLVSDAGENSSGQISAPYIVSTGAAELPSGDGVQGAYTLWNYNPGGQGSTNYVNLQGGGSGGFTWQNGANTSALSQLMVLNPAGQLNAISGLFNTSVTSPVMVSNGATPTCAVVTPAGGGSCSVYGKQGHGTVSITPAVTETDFFGVQVTFPYAWPTGLSCTVDSIVTSAQWHFANPVSTSVFQADAGGVITAGSNTTFSYSCGGW